MADQGDGFDADRERSSEDYDAEQERQAEEAAREG
jgi:hypothetical protein